MILTYENGKAAFLSGFSRSANPVAYTGEGCRFSAARARARDAWFAGWDDAAGGC